MKAREILFIHQENIGESDGGLSEEFDFMLDNMPEESPNNKKKPNARRGGDVLLGKRRELRYPRIKGSQNTTRYRDSVAQSRKRALREARMPE